MTGHGSAQGEFAVCLQSHHAGMDLQSPIYLRVSRPAWSYGGQTRRLSSTYLLALYQVYVLSQPACTQSLNLWLKSVQVVAAAAAFADPRPIPFLSLSNIY